MLRWDSKDNSYHI